MSSTACIKWIKIGSPSFKPTLIVGLLLVSSQVYCTNPCITSLIFLALDFVIGPSRTCKGSLRLGPPWFPSQWWPELLSWLLFRWPMNGLQTYWPWRRSAINMGMLAFNESYAKGLIGCSSKFRSSKSCRGAPAGGHDFQSHFGAMNELACVSKVWNILNGEEEHVTPLW